MSTLITDKSLKSCVGCRFAIMKDWGYSNWTVEGTTFHCGKMQHPKDGFDRFYGEDVRLQYAEECESFSKGDCITMDCDYDEVPFTHEPELLILLFDLNHISKDDIKRAMEKGWFEGSTDIEVAELILRLF